MADDSPLLSADAVLHRAGNSTAAEPRCHQVPSLALREGEQQRERVQEKAPPESNGTEPCGSPPANPGGRGIGGRTEAAEGAKKGHRGEAGVTRSEHGGRGGGERGRGRRKRQEGGRGASQERGRVARSVGDQPSLTECGTLPSQAKEKSGESL